MTYAAEPYAQFVDDLLSALTGGAVREQFRFLPEEEPYRLAAPAPVIPGSVRVFGLADGVYARFRARTDFVLGPEQSIAWQKAADGSPARDARWPDAGSAFFVNYEYAGSNPQLTDRNPGSVTRLLAESFAREFAVMSRQLDAVYQAGFLDTASGRDLEQIAALLGVTRRRRLSAAGSVVFSRASPAPADINIPAGTRISSSEPPAVVFETTADRTLQRGNLSVDAPIAATVAGAAGLVPAQAASVMNRPILGIDAVANPQPTRFSGADESDEALRARARRALEASGKATTGALLGALTTLPGLREKDIRIAEDYLAHPGVVKLNVALPEMAADELAAAQTRAVALIEATRPLGVRIEHNISAPLAAGAATPGEGAVAEDTAAEPVNLAAAADAADVFLPVNVEVKLTPTTLSLSADERARLTRTAEDTIKAFFADAGIGEILIYNRLVSRLIQLDGVLDVALRMYPQAASPAPVGRKNLVPLNPDVKPTLGAVTVQLGGALIMLDVSLAVTLKGAALAAPSPLDAQQAARADAAAKLQDFVATLESGSLSVNRLKGALPGTDTYEIGDLHYSLEFVEAGLRVHQQDIEFPLTGLERLWVRNVALLNGGGA
ncbi:MAG: baseplate J/gp47 family protein [Rhodocyclaceae bacterium]|nr:baseplate J/gp47 family protein [Rhodocyclaceae bacterium]